MADQSEVDRILSQYGQARHPALNSGDGEIASTPDILAQYGANERMSSGIPGFLRRIGAGLRSLAPSQVTTPVNTLTGREPNLRSREDHANPLMLMGGEGADTMASWIDMHPGVDRGQSRPQDLLAPLGLSAMAPLTAVNNAAGIFGGRLARTADREALSRAEEMAGRGVPRNEIWDQTGWFKGPDGKWRFEIDDSMSRWNPEIAAADLDVGSAISGYRDGFGRSPLQRDLFEHPALYEAYPGAERIGLGSTRELGIGGSYDNAGNISLNTLLRNDGDLRSTNLHELQHAVQQTEGFGRGASHQTFQQQTEAQLARDALSFRREIEAANFPPGVDWIAKENAIIDQYRRLGAMDWVPSREARDLASDYHNNPNAQLSELVRAYGLDQRTTPHSPRDMYHRTAGEVEARNVQTRRDFSPEARRAVPPWQSQDVPDADQILRQYSSGPQMSVPRPEPRTEMEAFDLLPQRVREALQERPHSAMELATLQRIGLGEDELLRWMGAAPPHPPESFALTPDMLRTMVERDPSIIPQRQQAVDRARADLAANPSNAGLRAALADAESDLAELFGARSPPPATKGPTTDDVLRQYSQGPQMSTKGPPRREYPIAPRGEWYGDANFEATGGRMTYMTPEEFLARARPMELDDVARENIADLRRHMEEGRTLDPLALYATGREDGRHRAHAARELGINRLPVLVWE